MRSVLPRACAHLNSYYFPSTSCSVCDMGNQLFCPSQKPRLFKRSKRNKGHGVGDGQVLKDGVRLIPEESPQEKEQSRDAENVALQDEKTTENGVEGCETVQNGPNRRSATQCSDAAKDEQLLLESELDTSSLKQEESQDHESLLPEMRPRVKKQISTVSRGSSLPDLSLLTDSDVAPPLPPKCRGLPPSVKVHRSGSAAGVSSALERAMQPRIQPVKKLGIQQTHTHYFLLAPKPHSEYVNLQSGTCEPSEKAEAKSGADNVAFSYSDMPPEHSKRCSLVNDGIVQLRSLHRKFSEGGSDMPVKHGVRRSVLRQSVSQTQLSPAVDSPPPLQRPSSVHEPLLLIAGCTDRDARDEEVKAVLEQVHGSTEEECAAVLAANAWHTAKAVRALKVEQLFRLGRVSKEQCRRLLHARDWNLELAAADLLGVPAPLPLDSSAMRVW